ncbi:MULTISPECIES: tryptophan synthase subunit beta [Gardnerella]|uniref:tryptophan synthase subunit beta n=1 Tax=Gardnerella TaxID=2701 RepID=UPI0001D424F0|nr:tryptophan synthase subunit beta [Gardnerella leopoldii]EFH27534.1 tryptophan synthase subunit beta [Gardnerella vaginalis AMD]EIK78234.1 tryptophan synthase subunit beta [Gardnerella vaginalis 6420B]NSX42205.1 tryptophan synthase subunit beta [Gardnerella vaginalis]RFT32500.1 tryptophan synthase subunit beta [Bifidobacteriaceae bacterium NR019]RFT35549.1 tryptophan synthase subunit beta [Bifidobacteriaceae bacterium NR017]RIY23111.1 tryptophan synthase subunit beta [Bifidobacteriaceae bac
MVNAVEQNMYYGEFGGQYVPDMIRPALDAVAAAYLQYKDDPEFRNELAGLLKDYDGRETPLYYAESFTKYLGGAKVYLKREDLNHLGAHKMNNVLGQILLAQRMGKKRIIAETGAGQHGVATAAAAARFGMECEIFMGALDCERQKLNVFRMTLLGAKVHAVQEGTKTLKDAVTAAFMDYAQHLDDTFYIVGSAVGPYPYPQMVRDFQSVISKESRRQILEKEGRLPNAVIACIGGGSNAIGSFAAYIDDPSVRLIGAEGAGKGADTPQNAATMTNGKIGITDGMKTYVLMDDDGNELPAYSISAGLDYPGVGPEHSYLKDSGRAEYYAITDDEAVQAFRALSRVEGIIPALESSHAIAQAMKMVPKMSKDDIVLVTVSGRGDKDVNQVARYLGIEL